MITQEELQRLAIQQGTSPQIIASALGEKRNNDFDRWRHEIEDLLTEKEYNVRGYFYDPTVINKETGKKGAWVKKGEARVNEIGAKVIRNHMGGLVNKVSTLTVLTIDEINVQTLIMTKQLNRLFYLNHEKYGLKSPTDGSNLIWEIAFFCFNGLKQSEGGASMKALSEMSRTIRQEVVGGEKKGGFFGIFRRGGSDS